MLIEDDITWSILSLRKLHMYVSKDFSFKKIEEKKYNFVTVHGTERSRDGQAQRRQKDARADRRTIARDIKWPVKYGQNTAQK